MRMWPAAVQVAIAAINFVAGFLLVVGSYIMVRHLGRTKWSTNPIKTPSSFPCSTTMWVPLCPDSVRLDQACSDF